MIRCSTCQGDRRLFAFVNTGPDARAHRQEWVRCHTCDGSGEITEGHAKRIEAGKAMRRARIARRETLAGVARRLGLTTAQLSAIEHGRG